MARTRQDARHHGARPRKSREIRLARNLLRPRPPTDAALDPGTRWREGVAGDVQMRKVRQDLAEVHELLWLADEEGVRGDP
jgi:hypothetical protein